MLRQQNPIFIIAYALFFCCLSVNVLPQADNPECLETLEGLFSFDPEMKEIRSGKNPDESLRQLASQQVLQATMAEEGFFDDGFSFQQEAQQCYEELSLQCAFLDAFDALSAEDKKKMGVFRDLLKHEVVISDSKSTKETVVYGWHIPKFVISCADVIKTYLLGGGKDATGHGCSKKSKGWQFFGKVFGSSLNWFEIAKLFEQQSIMPHQGKLAFFIAQILCQQKAFVSEVSDRLVKSEILENTIKSFCAQKEKYPGIASRVDYIEKNNVVSLLQNNGIGSVVGLIPEKAASILIGLYVCKKVLGRYIFSPLGSGLTGLNQKRSAWWNDKSLDDVQAEAVKLQDAATAQGKVDKELLIQKNSFLNYSPCDLNKSSALNYQYVKSKGKSFVTEGACAHLIEMVIFEQLLPAFFVSQTLNTSFDVALKKWNFFDWKAFDYGVIKNDALQNPIVHSAIMNSMSLGCNVFGSGLWDLAFKNAKTSTVKNCENFSLGLINPTLPEQAMSLFCGHIILSDEKQVKPLKESIVDNSRNKLNSGYVSIANAFGHELADPLCSQNKVLSKGDFTKRFAANYFAKNTGGFIVGKALSLCSRTVSFVAKKCGGLVSSGCVAVGLLKEETRQSWSFAYKGMKKIVAKMIYDVSRGKRIEGLSRVKAMHLTRLSQSLRFGLGDPFAFQKGFSQGVVTRGFGRKIAMDVCKTVLKTDFGKNYLSSPTVDLSITTSGCNVPKYLVWALGWILTSPVDHLLQAHYDFDQLLPTESALSLLVKKNEIYPTKQELFALACKVGIKDVQEDKIENFSLEEGKMVKQVIISMVTDSELLGLVSQFDYSSLLQMKSRAGLIF